MWIDTHIHLDAEQYEARAQLLIAQARSLGVSQWLIPAVEANNFDCVRLLAHRTAGAAYALGIHPMRVAGCPYEALDQLQAALEANKKDPKLVAIGEIGLDYFAFEHGTQTRELQVQRQQVFFTQQLKLARRYGLPVLLHVRRSQDHIAKYIRLHPVCSGIAHAFNGSAQQANALIELNLCLGFGGAATYARALQIRQRLASVPETAIVLETDGPDIAPEWLSKQVNPPAALARIGQTLATIRGLPELEFARLTAHNSWRIIPKLNATQ